MRRTSLEETEINGQRIGPYEKIALWYGAANRDPDVFEDPDKFNILRDNADKHLAFGIGRHTCIGKPVALMQLQEFYSQFLTRFQDFEMNGDWKVAPNNFVHAIQEMPIKFSHPNNQSRMRYLIFLIFSISLISDEGDIVERKILDTEIYKKSQILCRPKLKNNESTWFEDFDNPQLS